MPPPPPPPPGAPPPPPPSSGPPRASNSKGKAGGDRSALLSQIKNGPGGGLRSVPKSEIRDNSGPKLAGSSATASSAPPPRSGPTGSRAVGGRDQSDSPSRGMPSSVNLNDELANLLKMRQNKNNSESRDGSPSGGGSPARVVPNGFVKESSPGRNMSYRNAQTTPAANRASPARGPGVGAPSQPSPVYKSSGDYHGGGGHRSNNGTLPKKPSAPLPPSANHRFNGQNNSGVGMNRTSASSESRLPTAADHQTAHSSANKHLNANGELSTSNVVTMRKPSATGLPPPAIPGKPAGLVPSPSLKKPAPPVPPVPPGSKPNFRPGGGSASATMGPSTLNRPGRPTIPSGWQANQNSINGLNTRNHLTTPGNPGHMVKGHSAEDVSKPPPPPMRAPPVKRPTAPPPPAPSRLPPKSTPPPPPTRVPDVPPPLQQYKQASVNQNAVTMRHNAHSINNNEDVAPPPPARGTSRRPSALNPPHPFDSRFPFTSMDHLPHPENFVNVPKMKMVSRK